MRTARIAIMRELFGPRGREIEIHQMAVYTHLKSFRDYAALRVHFKAEHYLCEEGDCAEEQFTAVFRTEIDLRGMNNLI